MAILLRLITGIIGAVLGIIVAFVLDLFIGDGISFIPISKFIIPLAIGGAIGFCLGFVFYKATGRLFGFLGRFGIEASP